MCGIAGTLGLSGRPAEAGLLRGMARSMAHRGPDDEGIHVDGPLGLAFRRLAVIDLTPAGHQPMSTADGRLWLVFNGEIYNHVELRHELTAAGHRFRSRTDSEVILHAYEQWGEECLGRLLGMFALALWDRQDRSLVLARDRLGIKPLYYTQPSTTFAFASEIKALRVLPGVGTRVRPQAIAQYLALTYPVDDGTWFEGVHRLPPGGLLRVDVEGGVRLRTWWDPIDLYRNPVPGSGSDAAERIRALLDDAIRIHLRSDVPLGAHLSGGVDSSTVVGLMAQGLEAPVTTFSGAFVEGEQYDERRWIRAVVERFRTDHHEVVPSAPQLVDDLPRITWHMDEPWAGPGVFPQYRVCRLVRDVGVTVVNGGQGGDEVFGGYPRYLLHLTGAASRRPAWTRPAVLRSTARAAIYGGDVPRVVTGLHPDLARALRGYRVRRPVAVPGDPVADAMYGDLRYYLPALLHVEDRTSMAASVESRVPLLDHRLVELAASIPAAEKLAGGQLKPLLRGAVRDVLPDEVSARTDKRGFPTPVGPWFRGPLRDWVSELLLDRDFLARRVMSEPAVRLLLSAHRHGLPGTTQPLWSAASIALWFRVFGADVTW